MMVGYQNSRCLQANEFFDDGMHNIGSNFPPGGKAAKDD